MQAAHAGQGQKENASVRAHPYACPCPCTCPTATFATLDITDVYYITPLAEVEYIIHDIAKIPTEIQQERSFDAVAEYGKLLLVVHKTLPGLPQAGAFCRAGLVENLAKHEYLPVNPLRTVFKHTTNPIVFMLVVDGFSVKYKAGGPDLDHIIAALSERYKITVGCTDTRYIAITFGWYYISRAVTTSVPGYMDNVLLRAGIDPNAAAAVRRVNTLLPTAPATRRACPQSAVYSQHHSTAQHSSALHRTAQHSTA
jgi:hypothetical protein